MKKILGFNLLQFLAMAALIAAGTVAIWSAGSARSTALFHEMWKVHLLTALVSLVLYFALAFIDYRRYLDFAAWPAYAAALVLLVLVLVFGTDMFGGKRWLWFFQPSELAKLCVIVAIASVFGRLGEDSRLHGFGGALVGGVMIAVPVLLILMEPDLGTALTLVPATVLMLFTAGVWRKGLAAIAVIGAFSAMALVGVVDEAVKPGVSRERREQVLRYVPLKEHQVNRIKTFLYPDEDRNCSGYNYRQAMIAIGSGGLTGKGLGKGESNHLKYLPPKVSMNDFIFCVWAEELGFVGSAALLAVFAVLILSGLWTAFRCVDLRGKLLALGISSLVFAHVFINIAMSIGIVPITGLPLPFISSGRTFLVTVMAGLGLVQSISIHGRES